MNTRWTRCCTIAGTVGLLLFTLWAQPMPSAKGEDHDRDDHSRIKHMFVIVLENIFDTDEYLGYADQPG